MNDKYHIDQPNRLSIKKRLRFLFRDSFIYGGAGALNKLMALVTFPILARYFSVEEYGNFDFLNTLITLATLFFVFGLDSAFSRYFYERSNTAYRKALISESLLFQVFVSSVAVIAIWFYSDVLAERLFNMEVGTSLIKVIILQIPCLVIINFTQNILKVTFARSYFLIIAVGSTFFSVIGIVLGIYLFDLNLLIVFQIYLIVRFTFAILGLLLCSKWFIIPTSFNLLKEVMPFAIPYGVICTISALMPALERVIIKEFLTDFDLGLYAAGAKIGMLIKLPIQAFNLAWMPFVFSLHKEEDAHETYLWVIKIFVYCIFIAVLVLTVFADFLILLLASEKYSSAFLIVFPVAFAFAIQAIGTILSIGIDLSKKSYLKLYGYVLFLVSSVISMYFLVQPFGLMGVAWGALIGYLVKMITESFFAQKVYHIEWPYLKITSLLCIMFTFGFLYQYFAYYEDFFISNIFLGLLMIIISVYTFVRVFDENDRMLIQKAMRNKFK